MPNVKPSRALRRLFRAPVYLYHWRCGWLLGHRFLLLRHTGRRTGLRHETVLEVLEYRPNGSEAVVMSAYGRSADWLQNLAAAQTAEVWVGALQFAAEHRVVGAEEAVLAVKGYEQRNWWMAPVVRAGLSYFLGWRYRSTDGDRKRLVSQLPLIAFRPRV